MEIIACVLLVGLAAIGMGAMINNIAESYRNAKIEMEIEEAVKEREDTHDRRVEIAEVAKKAMVPDLNGIASCFMAASASLEDIKRRLSIIEETQEQESETLREHGMRLTDIEMAHLEGTLCKLASEDNNKAQLDKLGKGKKNGNHKA